MTSEYIQETSSTNILTHKENPITIRHQQPIFAETCFPKQPHTSQVNTCH